MLHVDYEKILMKGKKVEWYDTSVPEKLITKLVTEMANQMMEQINKLNSVDYNKNKDYINALMTNIRELPYKMNGDFYLMKKSEIESKVKIKKGNIVTPIKEESTKKTKNSSLIFGSKTNKK